MIDEERKKERKEKRLQRKVNKEIENLNSLDSHMTSEDFVNFTEGILPKGNLHYGIFRNTYPYAYQSYLNHLAKPDYYDDLSEEAKWDYKYNWTNAPKNIPNPSSYFLANHLKHNITGTSQEDIDKATIKGTLIPSDSEKEKYDVVPSYNLKELKINAEEPELNDFQKTHLPESTRFGEQVASRPDQGWAMKPIISTASTVFGGKLLGALGKTFLNNGYKLLDMVRPGFYVTKGFQVASKVPTRTKLTPKRLELSGSLENISEPAGVIVDKGFDVGFGIAGIANLTNSSNYEKKGKYNTGSTLKNITNLGLDALDATAIPTIGGGLFALNLMDKKVRALDNTVRRLDRTLDDYYYDYNSTKPSIGSFYLDDSPDEISIIGGIDAYKKDLQNYINFKKTVEKYPDIAKKIHFISPKEFLEDPTKFRELNKELFNNKEFSNFISNKSIYTLYKNLPSDKFPVDNETISGYIPTFSNRKRFWLAKKYLMQQNPGIGFSNIIPNDSKFLVSEKTPELRITKNPIHLKLPVRDSDGTLTYGIINGNQVVHSKDFERTHALYSTYKPNFSAIYNNSLPPYETQTVSFMYPKTFNEGLHDSNFFNEQIKRYYSNLENVELRGDNGLPLGVVVGSTRLIGNGFIGGIPHDVEILTTKDNLASVKSRLAFNKLRNLQGVQGENGTSPFGLNEGDIDINVLEQDANGLAVGKLAHEIAASIYGSDKLADYYTNTAHALIESGKKAGDINSSYSTPIPKFDANGNIIPGEYLTANELLQTYQKLSPEKRDLAINKKLILDAFKSSKDKHFERVTSLLQDERPFVVEATREAIRELGKSLGGSKFKLIEEQYPNFNFDITTYSKEDVEKVKDILTAYKINPDILNKPNAKDILSNVFNKIYIDQLTGFRGVDYNGTNPIDMINVTHQYGGGAGSGIGGNTVTNTVEGGIGKQNITGAIVYNLKLPKNANIIDLHNHLRPEKQTFNHQLYSEILYDIFSSDTELEKYISNEFLQKHLNAGSLDPNIIFNELFENYKTKNPNKSDEEIAQTLDKKFNVLMNLVSAEFGKNHFTNTYDTETYLGNLSTHNANSVRITPLNKDKNGYEKGKKLEYVFNKQTFSKFVDEKIYSEEFLNNVKGLISNKEVTKNLEKAAKEKDGIYVDKRGDVSYITVNNETFSKYYKKVIDKAKEIQSIEKNINEKDYFKYRQKSYNELLKEKKELEAKIEQIKEAKAKNKEQYEYLDKLEDKLEDLLHYITPILILSQAAQISVNASSEE